MDTSHQQSQKRAKCGRLLRQTRYFTRPKRVKVDKTLACLAHGLMNKAWYQGGARIWHIKQCRRCPLTTIHTVAVCYDRKEHIMRTSSEEKYDLEIASAALREPIPWYKNGCRVPLLDCVAGRHEDDVKYSLLARNSIKEQIPNEKYIAVTWEEAEVDVANYEGVVDDRKTMEAWRIIAILVMTKVVPTDPAMPLSEVPKAIIAIISPRMLQNQAFRIEPDGTRLACLLCVCRS